MPYLETHTVDGVQYDLHDKRIGNDALDTTAQLLIPAINELHTDLDNLYDDVHGTTEIYSWANGTEAQIKAMVDAHYANQINLYDYWSVGDVRDITLNGQSHQLVLMHKGGKELVTPINGHTECAFIVGLKDCMADPMVYHNNYSSAVWNGMSIRTYCNDTFRSYFSTTMKALFKQFKNISIGNNLALENTNDYFSVPAHLEVFPNLESTVGAEATYLHTFTWYRTFGNTYKSAPGVGGTVYYWLRSFHTGNGSEYQQFYQNIVEEGYQVGQQRKSNSASDNKYYVSPYGVI